VPRYQYRCSSCDKTQTIQHLSSELLKDCGLCERTDTLTKLLSTFSTAKKTTSRKKTGQITEEFIQEARQDLKKQKTDLKENT
jgi:putative FmdB family regulatory protein